MHPAIAPKKGIKSIQVMQPCSSDFRWLPMWILQTKTGWHDSTELWSIAQGFMVFWQECTHWPLGISGFAVMHQQTYCSWGSTGPPQPPAPLTTGTKTAKTAATTPTFAADAAATLLLLLNQTQAWRSVNIAHHHRFFANCHTHSLSKTCVFMIFSLRFGPSSCSWWCCTWLR